MGEGVGAQHLAVMECVPERLWTEGTNKPVRPSQDK